MRVQRPTINLQSWSYIARCWDICQNVPISTTQQPHQLCLTHLIVNDCIPDIFRHSGHDQNIILTFRIIQGADTTAE